MVQVHRVCICQKKPGPGTHLRRDLGPVAVTLSGIGIILGAGIYALLGEAAGMAGNAVWLAFAIAAVIAGLSALSYAELSSMYPRASAEYEYVSSAFGRRLAFVVGWLIIFSASSAPQPSRSGLPATSTSSVSAPPSAVLIILLNRILLPASRRPPGSRSP